MQQPSAPRTNNCVIDVFAHIRFNPCKMVKWTKESLRRRYCRVASTTIWTNHNFIFCVLNMAMRPALQVVPLNSIFDSAFIVIELVLD